MDDIDIVNMILTDDSIYPFITDDGSLEVNDFNVAPFLINDKVYFLGDDKSCFIFIPKNSITYDLHSNVLPEARKDSVKLVKYAAGFMFHETPCMKIITWVPEYNRRALNFAFKSGASFEGISHAGFLKNGKLYDEYLFGMTKGDYIQCQQHQH